MRARYLVMLTAFFFVGCRSDADKMAEFCLNFENAVNRSEDCAQMASLIQKELDKTVVLYDTTLCETTTACLPCKKASRRLLSECSHADEMQPVFKQMNFSKALSRADSNQSDE